MKKQSVIFALTLMTSFSANAWVGPIQIACNILWGDCSTKTAKAPVTIINQTIENKTYNTEAEKLAAYNLQVLEQKADEARRLMQERFTMRLNEIQTVNNMLYQESLNKGLPFSFNYEKIDVKNKSIIKEEKIDSVSATCNRKISDTFVTLLSYPEYKSALEKAKVKNIQIELFDNRDSSRSDKMFSVGAIMTPGKSSLTTTKYYVPFFFTDASSRNQGNSKCLSEDLNGDCEVSKSDYYRIIKLWPYLLTDKRAYIRSSVIKKEIPTGFKIQGLVTADGSCFDLTEELIAKFELLSHPEETELMSKVQDMKTLLGVNDMVKSDILNGNRDVTKEETILPSNQNVNKVTKE